MIKENRKLDKKNLLKKFAKNLKRIRLDKNITQEQMADLMNIHVVTYSHYESTNKPYNISLYNLYLISEILNVTLSDLIK